MSSTLSSNARVAKWDNAKAFLIILVVLGHIMFTYTSNNYTLRMIEFIINSFHMPLFIFICGLFAKSTVYSKPFRYEKIVGFVLLFYLMKILIHCTILIWGRTPKFQIFYENGTPWFIFALAMMYLIARAVRFCEPKKILALSIILALLVGYCSLINNIMVSSRIIVLFPYFYLGLILDKDKVLTFVNRPCVRILSVIVLSVFIAVVFVIGDKIYGVRNLFTANHPYKDFGADYYPFGAILRLATYCISTVVGTAVLSLIPNFRIPVFTLCGTKTLQIYALHRVLVYCIHYSPIHELIKTQSTLVIFAIVVGFSLIICLILMQKPFEYVIYPCTNWQTFFSPVLKFFRKKDTTNQ